jgi:hypothetical protein
MMNWDETWLAATVLKIARPFPGTTLISIEGVDHNETPDFLGRGW